MKEKDLQTIFNRQIPTFIHKFPSSGTINIESKLIDISKSKSIPFAEVVPHQVRALRQSRDHYLAYKIPDDSSCTKPFDLTIWRDCWTYICLFWYEARKLKEAHLIPLSSFILMKSTVTRKSITYEMSKGSSEFIVTL